MAQLWMKHPNHGRMPVYSNSEIEYNRKNGWELEQTEQTKITAAVAKPTITETSEETSKTDEESSSGELESRYEAKFGKKPHHRMKPENIEAALAE